MSIMRMWACDPSSCSGKCDLFEFDILVSFPSFSHCDWCAAFADAVCFKVEDVEMFLTMHAVHRKAICHMDYRGFRIREVCGSIGRERLHNILEVSWCDDHQFEMTGELNDLSN